MPFGLTHVDYLQRMGSCAPEQQFSGSMTDVPVILRRLWRIHGVGVTEKDHKKERPQDLALHLPTLDLLMGLYGFRTPVAFLIQAQQSGRNPS